MDVQAKIKMESDEYRSHLEELAVWEKEQRKRDKELVLAGASQKSATSPVR